MYSPSKAARITPSEPIYSAAAAITAATKPRYDNLGVLRPPSPDNTYESMAPEGQLVLPAVPTSEPKDLLTVEQPQEAAAVCEGAERDGETSPTRRPAIRSKVGSMMA